MKQYNTSGNRKTVLCGIVLLGVFLNTLNVHAQFYTGSQMEFGKNRIKYDDFFWTYYAYDRYDVYFYTGGKNVADYVSKAAESEIKSIEKFFDFSMEDRYQFIIYNKHSEFMQSNIGLASEEEYNIGGVTRIAGTKIILYYEGDHAKLKAQIRDGIAQVLVDQMLYGGSLRQMLKNNTLLNLPEWYLNGLYSYLSLDWNSDIDNRVKDGILSGKYKNLNRLEGENATYAGHAFWKYIANNYGESTISNVLYMAKISRNIENSTIFVLGLSLGSLWDDCLESFKEKYQTFDAHTTSNLSPVLHKKAKTTRVYQQIKVSPDDLNCVYTTDEMGQKKVWLYNTQTQKHKRVIKIGYKLDRIVDYSYPLLAWHPSGKVFSYIIESKGEIVMRTYELATGDVKENKITGIQKVLDFSYSDNGKEIVMSAVKNGQTDIYTLRVGSTAYLQITDDIYDDLTPRYVHGGKGIIFSSNRPNDTLVHNSKYIFPEAQELKDIFLFDNLSKSSVLTRVTNTPSTDESYPSDYDSTHIAYLSNANGVRNRFVASFDSVISFIDTTTHYRTVVYTQPISNYSRSIVEHDVNVKAKKFSEVVFKNGRYNMYVSPIPSLDTLKPVELSNTSYQDYKERIEQLKREEAIKREKKLDKIPTVKNVVIVKSESVEPEKKSAEININNYTFEDEKKPAELTSANTTEPVSVDTVPLKKKPFTDFELAKRRNYNTSFSIEYVITQLDNSYLNRTYQTFSGGGSPIYLNPGLNAFIKLGISDLFEDYRIIGGVRFSNDLLSNEYFLSYEDRMQNLDKQLVLHRQGLRTEVDNQLVKILTHDARYMVKHPFNEVESVRGALSFRNDRTVYLSTNDQNLLTKDQYQNWASVQLQYVFDNTIPKGLNLYNGMRAKVFGEYYKQVDKKKTDFFVVGTDVRYYQKIHRSFIWANRFAASSSFGNQKLIYYMGGVDKWFIPQFDKTTNIATDQNYAYQTIATNMRGFFQNARNGNSFAVINSELRFPFFQYIAKRPIRSDFAKHFQIVGFFDLGTAWTGFSPYSDDNSLNTTIIGNSKTPLIITLNSNHNPIIGGYGYGLRARLFGYFIRFDRAWGIQDGVTLLPISYLSLSLDF